MNFNDNWYIIENIDQVDSPALVIFPDRVKENIRLLKQMIDDPLRLRPHVKTNKCIEATELLIDQGISKFKCATIAEAEMLGTCKAKDVLLAYQPVGPKLERFIKLIKKFPETKFSCLTDNEKTAYQISQACYKNNISINIFIDINAGMNRTGIVTQQEALDLYTFCSQQKNINPFGLHVYDGHLHQPDIQQRMDECNKVFAEVQNLWNLLINQGFPEPCIVAGGTPTFPIHAKRKNVECSPGTFIYWDKGYCEICSEQPFRPAVVLITRVISLPDATKICVDLGHKSVSAENELEKRVYFLNAPELKPLSQSEEHLVLEAGSNHKYRVGDLLIGIPYHVCPTVALYEKASTVENGKVSGEWKTIARDRKITI